MKIRLKHDVTREAIASVDALEQLEDRVRDLLRSYIQGDQLSDVCSAREAGFHLKNSVDDLVRQLCQLADAEVASRALRAEAEAAGH
ncbi:hypothetical protein Afil01_52870 [Actinorhabdospora filicis]|uniref:Uncharacterized protein n=1 Tax=Actinorhabdospora filicis TaxID=1785913 RepID=A0A9W6WD55_9ACTN|nr:hypothetical protein [Actinorhabdospora filicis]GLZ80480.1 hypothetical protein Afil01_52870 [Actinorhabdospora filicis]